MVWFPCLITSCLLLDVNDLFDGIAEAFRQYQAEMAEQEQASSNPIIVGLVPEAEAGQTEKKVAAEKRVEGNFPKRE